MYDRDDPDYHWSQEARCANSQRPDDFFPPREGGKYKEIADRAKAFCFGENGNNPCPVRHDCLWDAVSSKERHGIWGGLSHRERNAVERRWIKKYSDDMDLEDFIYMHGRER